MTPDQKTKLKELHAIAQQKTFQLADLVSRGATGLEAEQAEREWIEAELALKEFRDGLSRGRDHYHKRS